MGPCGLETLIMNWYRKMDRQKVQFDFLVHHKAVDFYEEEIFTVLMLWMTKTLSGIGVF